MGKRTREPIRSATVAAAGLSPVGLDPSSRLPLYRQVYDALRRDILGGTLASGRRLTSTRAMAEELGVSRNTVLEAVEQLAAEGYLTSRVGSGTYVAEDLPEALLHVGRPSRLPADGSLPAISSRGRLFESWAGLARRRRGRPFQLGRPALDAFPWKTWNRLLAKRAQAPPREWLDYSDSAGYRPLREALARYLRGSRGLDCEAEQVVVVRGSQQGLDLAARVLLDEGDAAWVEDPGYPAARIAFAAGGARVVGVPVDDEGLEVATGRRREPEARLAYVTPSHQFPLGVTLSLPRRLELLAWAREAGAWIVEDDY
ncbi:MAG: PLP-dependent aminotransferase family protein, partial [Acidobacteria bacterium]|nr:PLP-dependent aminotransferase family protein [Acidobacteriota bacterium]